MFYLSESFAHLYAHAEYLVRIMLWLMPYFLTFAVWNLVYQLG